MDITHVSNVTWFTSNLLCLSKKTKKKVDIEHMIATQQIAKDIKG